MIAAMRDIDQSSLSQLAGKLTGFDEQIVPRSRGRLKHFVLGNHIFSGARSFLLTGTTVRRIIVFYACLRWYSSRRLQYWKIITRSFT